MIKNIFNDCKWQARDEMEAPTNPLQSLLESFARTSRDMSEDKFDAWLYGVIVGWDDESYEDLKNKHNWTINQIDYQKLLHQNYIEAWNLFMEKQK